jgi:uncharacterized protein YbjT (DUF2867 family)
MSAPTGDIGIYRPDQGKRTLGPESCNADDRRDTTMTDTDDRPVLVVGGTGKTGHRVVDRLRARGVPVRSGSRSATGPDSARFDWDDRSTWGPALHAARAAYITYFPDLAAPGAADAVEDLAATAVDHGLERLVLLSGRGEDEAQESERRLAKAADRWTVVRASWFCQNFSEGFAAELIGAGEVFLPAGSVPEPFVDADDIADVAVAALTDEGLAGERHANRVYEVTGRELVTFPQAVAAIGAACGRDVRYTQVPLDDFAAELRRVGEPDEVVGLLRYLFGEVLDGRNAYVTDGVREALGRPARGFSDYVRDAAAAGSWQV